MPRLTLVLGGARSGKSAYAERLILGQGASAAHATYVATAEALDDEMRARIAHHRALRGRCWTTIEEPRDLSSALDRARALGQPVLIDCLTLWLSNLLLADHDLEAAANGLLETLSGYPSSVVLVANEVGLGIVPDNALARRFRDAAGRLNQAMAGICDRVVFIAAGLPLILK